MATYSPGSNWIDTTPPLIWPLSLSGLIPFAVALGMVAGAGDAATAAAGARAFVLYAALTLAFLGGVRWGAELQRAPSAPSLWRMTASVGPTAVGLFAVLMATGDLRGGMPLALGLLIACSLWQLVWDVSATRRGLLPAWNARLRIVLTTLGTLACVALFLVLPTAGQ